MRKTDESIFGLTLDEVQKRLGRPIAAVTLSELIHGFSPIDDNRTVGEVWREVHQCDGEAVEFGETKLGDLLAEVGIDVQGPNVGTRKSTLPSTSNLRRRGRKDHLTAERRPEKRQKRLIKNRESAARSRARRQAYRTELEIRVAQLEAENQRLRSQQQESPWLGVRRSRSAPPI